MIEWFQAPQVADSAIVIGDVNYSACKPTADTFAATAPTGAGYCTILARAADNPGYQADATPAARPRKALEAIGGAC